MSDKLYTREDMLLAYEEGAEYFSVMEYGWGRQDALPFEEFMLKHYPSDLTDAYTVSWMLPGDVTQYRQMIVAENEIEAIKKADEMLRDKRMKPKQYNIEKVISDESNSDTD